MVKECPFGRTAVQAEFGRLRTTPGPFDEGMEWNYDNAMEAGKQRFGECTENCALWHEHQQCCGILMIAVEVELIKTDLPYTRAGAEDGA